MSEEVDPWKGSKIILVVLIVLGIAFAGCGEKGGEIKSTPEPTLSTPMGPLESQQEVAQQLHGKGTCDMCHDAPTLEEMRSGDHKFAFERDPDLHKNLCSKCHEVSSFCGKCHPVPEVIKG
jgi:hypothetical protein